MNNLILTHLLSSYLPGPLRPECDSLGLVDPLEKETTTHSSSLAWKIPRTEEPGRLQSIGLEREDTTEAT